MNNSSVILECLGEFCLETIKLPGKKINSIFLQQAETPKYPEIEC